MTRSTTRDATQRVLTSLSRGSFEKNDDTKLFPEVDIEMLADEKKTKVERFQEYGITSYPKKPSQGQGGEGQGGGNSSQDGGGAGGDSSQRQEKPAEILLSFLGAERTHAVIFRVDDRRFRLRNFDEGEMAVYDDQQQKVHIQRQRIYTRSQYKIEQRVIKDEPQEDGHGSSEKASRDQKKDASKRLSTMVMDKDTITIERTKPKDNGGGGGGGNGQSTSSGGEGLFQPGDVGGQQQQGQQQAKEPEVLKLTQIKCTETTISIETFKEDKPNTWAILDQGQDLPTITIATNRNSPDDTSKTCTWMILKDDQSNPTVTLATNIQQADDPSKTRTWVVLKDDQDTPVITIGINKDADQTQPKVWIELREEDNNERVTVAAKKKVQLQTPETGDPNTAVLCDDDKEKVLLGDLTANTPVAMRGSIDSKGHRIVAHVSPKVLVPEGAGGGGSGGNS
ncbi:MAG TPA: phage baseplate assembly protein, partial [Acidobacteriaceae bacterium]